MIRKEKVNVMYQIQHLKSKGVAKNMTNGVG